MALDARIPLGVQPMQIEPRENALMRMYQMQGAQQQQQLNALKMQQYQQAAQQTLLDRKKAADLEAATEARLQQAMQGIPSPRLSPLGGNASPTPANQAMLGNDPRLQRLYELMQTRQIKPEDYIKEAYPTQEVARTVDVPDGKGGKMTVQLDKRGKRVGESLPGYIAPTLVDQGNQKQFVMPVPGASFPMGMSPEQKDASARGWASVNETRNQNALPTFDSASGMWVNRKTQTVTPAVGPDGKPMAGKAVAATEDERKASGWLAQADNAWNNMRAVAFDANGNIKEAAKPGFNDALAAIPSLGLTEGLANSMRKPDRQKFIQASASLSEALLRAATGAGVNESEARQKIQELTPTWGEEEATTKQKFEAIPMYLNALKARSGRAGPAGYTPPSVPSADGNKAPPIKFLGFE
jgi:hypothetical protein